MAGTVKGTWAISDTREGEFIRYEVSQLYNSDESHGAEQVAGTPSVRYQTDFNLFEKNEGTEVIRNTYDFAVATDQIGTLLGFLPTFIGFEIDGENSAMATAWGDKSE